MYEQGIRKGGEMLMENEEGENRRKVKGKGERGKRCIEKEERIMEDIIE